MSPGAAGTIPWDHLERPLAMPRDADDEPLEDEAYQSEEDAKRRRRREDDADREEDDDSDRERRRRRRRRDRDGYDDRGEQDIGQDAGMRMLLPVGRSGWAIASGYLGLISLICIPAPFALLTGILAVREMRRNPKLHGMGRAVFGIIMGSLGSLFLLLMLFGMAMAAIKGK
jgi:hypothetical protein